MKLFSWRMAAIAFAGSIVAIGCSSTERTPDDDAGADAGADGAADGAAVDPKLAACLEAAEAVCAKGCECTTDALCHLVTKGDAGNNTADSHATKERCVDAYKETRCGSLSSFFDLEICKAEVKANACAQGSGKDGALVPASCQ